ncbi:SpoIIE family protein phosphatase [Iningainema tapete]|uniref:SpoIIE family protein phosphatase n=1 Tax=Iningainema tapete TaxID=2806730 RepID=UPI00192D42A9
MVANLGDSSLFHYQTSKKQLTKITEDHSVAGVLLQAEMITTEMARYHEGRHRLEYYLGCANLPPESPVHQVALASGDLLLLCTDGISSSFSNEQMNKIFTNAGGNLDTLAEHLVTTAQRAGETDNQTLILWQHHGKAVTAADTVVQFQHNCVPNVACICPPSCVMFCR